MRQVLFHLPFTSIPIYGFGMMLFITFLVTTWLASRRARKEGINPQHLQDLAIWVFVSGIIGARLTYMIQYGEIDKDFFLRFFMIWQGGLVFYGSFLGGAVGFLLAYLFVIRKHNLSIWKLADLVAPLVALGLCLGRLGCFLNGCCFGNVACPDCSAQTVSAFSFAGGRACVHFPLSAPARYQYVGSGYQTAAGFTMTPEKNLDARTVAAVEPGSPASESGLRAEDVLTQIDSRTDREMGKTGDVAADGTVRAHDGGPGAFLGYDLRDYLGRQCLRRDRAPARAEVRLTVQRDGKPVELSWFALPTTADPQRVDLGFTAIDCRVGEVDPLSPAYRSGLRRRDLIVRADDRPINSYGDLQNYLGRGDTWPRGKNDLRLTVVHGGQTSPDELPSFVPRTLGLHPTQLYESISTGLLFLALLAFHPFRRRDGMVLVVFMLGYGVHRFLNEMLRNDTDPVAFGMTLSQIGSILFVTAGLLLGIWLWRKPAQYEAMPASV
jgi:prolipoprotein diacylglyceryltransferase